MTKRNTILVALTLMGILASGCPGAGQYVGTWTVTIGMSDYGLTLNANGTATAFMIDGLFTGDVTWEAKGDRLTIHRDTGTDNVVYLARVVGDTATGGFAIWDGPGTGVGGEWSAVKQ